MVIGLTFAVSLEGQEIQTYVNGLWFDGTGFQPKQVWVQDGWFVEQPSAKPDAVIDLKGQWVVPPFGDGHTHNFGGPGEVDSNTTHYLRDGIFYVQVLTNPGASAAQIRDRFSAPGSIDVAWANGGITGTLGHPFIAYEPRAMGLPWTAYRDRMDEIRVSRIMERNAYWFIDSLEDLDSEWPQILDQSPDVLKIYLLDATTPRKEVQPGLIGLDTNLVPPIIDRAHRVGLRVYAHVETREDFRIALYAGVDGFAHLPGYGLKPADSLERFALTDELIREAGRRGVAITPTTYISSQEWYAGADSSNLARLQTYHIDVLRALHEAGAQILIGADSYGLTATPEAIYLNELEVFENAELLKLWSETTPRAIFPDRRIGRLALDYEASFLVLAENPLEDFDAVQSIVRRVKNGITLPNP